MKTKRNLSEICKKINGELSGLPAGISDMEISGITGLEQSGAEELTFIDEAGKIEAANNSKAAAVITPLDVDKLDKPIIRVKHPRLAFAQVLEMFAPEAELSPGVHRTAVIGEKVKLGQDVAIGAYCVIGDGVEIADKAIIYPQVYIGRDASIGANSTIHPQAVIGRETQIGADCIIHSGVVIGADGFGYIWDGKQHYKIPQIGKVVIEDNVEIGANTTIDRATTDTTRIGAGTKIDDQVHIAHNVQTGKNCILAGKVGVSGSVVLGDGVILAGQVGVGDHVKIGEGSTVLARSAVLKDLPAGSVASGIPAYPHKEYLRVEAATRKLPELLKEIRQLRKRIEELEKE